MRSNLKCAAVQRGALLIAAIILTSLATPAMAQMRGRRAQPADRGARYMAEQTTSYAQVKPGDFITSSNAAKVQGLVSPGVFYRVTHGMEMKIVKPERVDLPTPYREATNRFAGQVRF